MGTIVPMSMQGAKGAEIVGVTEIASRLRLKRRQVIHNWRARYPDFPEPVGTVNEAPAWLWPDIEAWARATGRLPTGRT